MKWLRHDSEIDDHPDVIFAGFYGARIAEALCRTSKKFDLGGVVPSKYATALYLSRQLGLDIDLCRKGLEDASRVNPDAEEGEPPLIVRDACGNVTIPGWDKINGDREIENIREKARARKERYKERHKNAVEQEKNVPGTFPNVTERDGTKGTGDGTGRDGTGRDGTKISDPSDPLAPSPRKTRTPKPDKLRLDIDSWEWVNVTPDIRQAWTQDYPAIDIDDELRKARAWVRADPSRKKSNWTRVLAGWFSRAQDKGGSKHAPVDFRAIERAAEREWQRVMQAGASNDFQKIGFAVAMLHPRTVAALKVIDKDPANAVWRMADIPLREQLTFKAAFIPAWKASGIPYEVEE